MSNERVARFFTPQSIALVGASEKGLYPAGILQDLQHYGYDGRIYPVNPRRERVFGLLCYPDLGALPERPDLVVIMTPRRAVLPVIDDCLSAGVRAALIITAGFGESDAEGVALEAALRARIAGRDLAVIGPNCAGLANLLTGTVVTRLPAPLQSGKVGFVSASGALMMALQGVFADLKLGLSRLASAGNQLDISLVDVLAYLVEDEDTQIIGAFVEGLTDGRRFLEVAEEARRRQKPIVLLKSGRTAAGQAAAATHTAALAGSDRVFRSACEQAGVMLADDMDELTRTLQLLAAWHGRYPSGRRLALVTQSGGMGSLTADWATRYDFVLPGLSPQLQADLQELPHLLAFDDFANPADVRGAGAVGPEAALTLRPFLASPDFDAAILLLAKSAVEGREVATARGLAELAATAEKPFCLVWVGQRIAATPDQTEEPLELLAEAGIPVFTQPSAAIRALAQVVAWQEGAAGPWPVAERPSASAPIGEKPAPRFLPYEEIAALLTAYDISLISGEIVMDADSAGRAAQTLGLPVALKGLTAQLSHKSDAGLLRLNLATVDAVTKAAHDLMQTLQDFDDARLLVQRMAPPGVEALVGVESDPHFGPALVCGPGGTLVELVDDVALHMTPLSQAEAGRMVDATRLGSLLKGLRGRPPSDRDAFIDLLMKLSRLAVAQAGRLASMDINPVIVHEEGLSIVDVRMSIYGYSGEEN